MHIRFLGTALVLTLILSPTWSEVVPHALFSDHMVLQQGKSIPVWGWADEGERVTVRLEGQRESTVTRDGTWKVTLDEMPAGGPYTMTIEGENTIEYTNVMIGEVWICSGQSNMQWTIANSANPEEELINARHANIRFFSVPRVTAGTPQDNVNGSWSVCTPRSARNFSAVAYYFGRSLQESLHVPIGLIHTSWGGTPAESWTRMDSLERNPDYKAILDRWQQDMENYPEQLDRLQNRFMDWVDRARAAEAQGDVVPGYPSLPGDPRRSSWRPSGLYNAMIAPLVPYAFQGAIWYQGESNAGRAYQYRSLFPDMIRSWRDSWSDAFPFLFVQLANFDTQNETGRYSWAELREAQLMTFQSLPHTGMAVTTDIGDPIDIHPRNKQDVGKRLAQSALHVAYDLDVVWSGPIYDSMEVHDDKVKLFFTHIGSGLMSSGHGALQGFEVAGADQEYHPAFAWMDGNQVIVTNPAVKEPVAVRYAWLDNPYGNLYNNEGLPASPFRTDDWPGVTVDVR